MGRQKFTPTNEQAAIVDACASGVNVKVEALAGTGKTSTLELAAHAMEGKKGLYLAFNKSVKDEAEKRFPSHVEARTAHSLAYRPVGSKFRSRMNSQSRISAKRMAEAFGVDGFAFGAIGEAVPPTAVASAAYGTVRRFCNSDAKEIGLEHGPWMDGLTRVANLELRKHILPYAEAMWEDLQQVGGYRAFFNHDHYLKIWALSEPELPYDFIYFDEAQDASPVMTAMVQAQSSQLIGVGDQNQAIYGWRGAKDALKDWPAEITLALTESFRFGPEVAEVANKWLSIPELNCQLRVTGRGPTSTVAPLASPEAILCRTNAGAIREALDRIDTPGQRVAVVGGGEAIRKMSEAAIDLQRGKRTTHSELAAFGSWSEVQTFVNTEEGAEDLAVFVRLVDEHGPDTLIDAVGALVDATEGRPTVTISTAHKAKGLEWGSVKIGSDFREPGLDEYGKLNKLDPAEAMLCYVAITRAKKELDQTELSWIDSYLVGKPSAAARKRWEDKQRKSPGAPWSPSRQEIQSAVREMIAEEREYRK